MTSSRRPSGYSRSSARGVNAPHGHHPAGGEAHPLAYLTVDGLKVEAAREILNQHAQSLMRSARLRAALLAQAYTVQPGRKQDHIITNYQTQQKCKLLTWRLLVRLF